MSAHLARAASAATGRFAPSSYPLRDRWYSTTRSPPGAIHVHASTCGHRALPNPRDTITVPNPKPRARVGSAAGCPNESGQ